MAGIVVAGLVRDCAHHLLSELEIIDKAFKNHTIKKIIVVESDSSDDTVKLLMDLQNKSQKYFFKSFGSLREKFPKRTERLAFCRNYYLEVCEINNYFGADFLFVTDLDGVNTHLAHEAVDTVIADLEIKTDIAATANQLYKYYDIWALRHPIWSPNDCWDSYHKMKPLFGEVAAQELCNLSRMVHIPAHINPIEVDSAFGGGALYPIKYLKNCRYIGITKEGNEVCEHVAFSKLFKNNGGKIAIYPNFINSNISEHVVNSEQFSVSKQSKSIV